MFYNIIVILSQWPIIIYLYIQQPLKIEDNEVRFHFFFIFYAQILAY